jgi:hypothetical protein
LHAEIGGEEGSGIAARSGADYGETQILGLFLRFVRDLV